MPSQQENLLGHRIDRGRLELIAILGLGAYGIVYLAQDIYDTSSHPAQYAVKCLHKTGLDARQRKFQHREIALHARVSDHPNVCTLHKVIETPSCLYVILEYADEGDLFGAITERQTYLGDDDLIKHVFLQIIDAVDHCHLQGIYHRDLKPENVLVSERGARVVLADFGLATTEYVSADFGCGSTFYMSPECQGGLYQRQPSYSTLANDIWSLGVILVNLSCGRNPWKQACLQDDTFRAFLKTPNFLQTILPISNAVNEILRRIFTVDPAQRISLSDLRRAIKAVDTFTLSEYEILCAQAQAQALAAAQLQQPQEEAMSECAVGDSFEGIIPPKADGQTLHVAPLPPTSTIPRTPPTRHHRRRVDPHKERTADQTSALSPTSSIGSSVGSSNCLTDDEDDDTSCSGQSIGQPPTPGAVTSHNSLHNTSHNAYYATPAQTTSPYSAKLQDRHLRNYVPIDGQIGPSDVVEKTRAADWPGDLVHQDHHQPYSPHQNSKHAAYGAFPPSRLLHDFRV